MNAARKHQCRVGIVPAFTSLMGTDRDKDSRSALRLRCPQGRKGPPAALAAGDLGGDMELLAVTALEEAGKDATASQAELKEKRKNMWIKPRNTTQQEENWMKEGEVK
ncbi:hypothetical protein HGM15179_005162 [Zosterops borbonicus]|uniref:Uncharacterized protein n=1 Tax=Zosterops borbonicus TaxID=364589 RepID=A0A8K1LQA5_9PASS|nr:hypothetical protein HGM15179_005162 [Zosterops borbonicus]